MATKTIQIPEKLFLDLCRLHLLDLSEDEAADTSERIREALQTKLEAVLRHRLYSQYKDTSLSPEARQQARKEYLDMVGVCDSHRWDSLDPPT